MARPLRIVFEGAYYHVMNRGQGKRDVFRSAQDYKDFENLLGQSCKVYGVEVVAYCLMRNHYHLLVRTPGANIANFMRQVNGVYTQVFNKKYRQDGALFRGRYKAMVVQEGAYLLRLIRYIHNNPVRAGLRENANDYGYSSQQYFLQGQEYEWLKYKEVLKGQWKTKEDIGQVYKQFMKQTDEEINEYLREKRRKAVWAIILGDEEYKDEISRGYLNSKRVYDEIPEGRRIAEQQVVERVKKTVRRMFKISEEDLYTAKRGEENIARLLAIRLLRECAGIQYKKIAEIVGGIGYKSAAKYYERVKKRCADDRKIDRIYLQLKRACSQVET